MDKETCKSFLPLVISENSPFFIYHGSNIWCVKHEYGGCLRHTIRAWHHSVFRYDLCTHLSDNRWRNRDGPIGLRQVWWWFLKRRNCAKGPIISHLALEAGTTPSIWSIDSDWTSSLTISCSSWISCRTFSCKFSSMFTLRMFDFYLWLPSKLLKIISWVVFYSLHVFSLKFMKNYE